MNPSSTLRTHKLLGATVQNIVARVFCTPVVWAMVAWKVGTKVSDVSTDSILKIRGRKFPSNLGNYLPNYTTS
jgi:hypothetical protein